MPDLDPADHPTPYVQSIRGPVSTEPLTADALSAAFDLMLTAASNPTPHRHLIHPREHAAAVKVAETGPGPFWAVCADCGETFDVIPWLAPPLAIDCCHVCGTPDSRWARWDDTTRGWISLCDTHWTGPNVREAPPCP